MLCTIPNEDRRKLSRKGVIFGLILCFLRKLIMEMLFALFLHEVMAYGEWALLMILFSAFG